MISLSWTMANRFERCAFLASAWRAKRVTSAKDQVPFFAGRVLHDVFEKRMLGTLTAPMYASIPKEWARQEATTELRWISPDQRAAAYANIIKASITLEETLADFDWGSLDYLTEQKFSAPLSSSVSIFAQPDIVALSKTAAPVFHVFELKSGSTYDAKQSHWYAAAARSRFPNLRFVGVALRPATTNPLTISEITNAQMDAQVQRALAIGAQLNASVDTPSPGSYCAVCEAKSFCPAAQKTFGSLQAGTNPL